MDPPPHSLEKTIASCGFVYVISFVYRENQPATKKGTEEKGKTRRNCAGPFWTLAAPIVFRIVTRSVRSAELLTSPLCFSRNFVIG